MYVLSKIDLKKCSAFEDVVISLESVKDFRAKALFCIKRDHTPHRAISRSDQWNAGSI